MINENKEVSLEDTLETRETVVIPELSTTVNDMLSGDYKSRFRAEYRQLNIRVQKLEIFLEDYRWNRLDFKPDCSLEILTAQCNSMNHYRTILEQRAAIEGIAL